MVAVVHVGLCYWVYDTTPYVHLQDRVLAYTYILCLTPLHTVPTHTIKGVNLHPIIEVPTHTLTGVTFTPFIRVPVHTLTSVNYTLQRGAYTLLKRCKFYTLYMGVSVTPFKWGAYVHQWVCNMDHP